MKAATLSGHAPTRSFCLGRAICIVQADSPLARLKGAEAGDKDYPRHLETVPDTRPLGSADLFSPEISSLITGWRILDTWKFFSAMSVARGISPVNCSCGSSVIMTPSNSSVKMSPYEGDGDIEQEGTAKGNGLEPVRAGRAWGEGSGGIGWSLPEASAQATG